MTSPSLDELKWISMTAMVNRIKSPRSFLQQLLYSNHDSIATETIEIDSLHGARVAAPFVRKNGEAIMVKGTSSKRFVVDAPNIRVKMPFTPSQVLFGRKPGTGIFLPSGTDQMSDVEKHIARDLKYMADQVTNTVEKMVADAITGTITYAVEDEEVYQITYNKPAGNTVDISGTRPWTDQTNSTPSEDVHDAKFAVSEEESLPVQIAICGAEAAAAFRKNAKIRTDLDTKNIFSGVIDLTQQYTNQGAIWLGRYSGVDFWEYNQSMDVNGVSTALIRSKWIEFMNVSPDAENIMYFAAIPDFEALEGNNFIGERFSKSWLEKDPSAMWALLHSRPLPVPRRPGSIYSLKVIAG